MTDAIADASSILEPEGRNVGLDLVLRHGERNVDVTAGGLGVGGTSRERRRRALGRFP